VKLKRSEGYDLPRHGIQMRKVASVILVLFGLIMLIVNVASWTLGSPAPLNSTLTIFTVVSFVLGVLILITENFESWLSRGQAALVDGLKAG
jgi:membrane-bound ClpP family serine protease